MNTSLDVRIISSFLLYVDHEIQRVGNAFTNETGGFYGDISPYSSLAAYTAPQKPMCNDTSISGTNVMSGVYLGGQYVTIGQSGLTAINHYKGAVYFTGTIPANVPITGSFSVKEINVKLTDKTDWKLLFDTQYLSHGGFPIPPATGLDLDTEVTPAVFLRTKIQENKPFGFARLDNQSISMRAIVIADNEFQKLGLTTILKNFNYRTIPLVLSTPFDSLGNYTGLAYNYNQLPIDSSYTPIIFGVKAIDVPQYGQYKDIKRNMAIVDFEISTIGRT